MPVAPDGTPLPYGPGDPGAMGAPVGPDFPSIDAGTLAQMAMQVIAEQADMDAEQFAMAQQEVMLQLPAMIQAIVDQLAAPPPETLDAAGGEQAAMMQAPAAGGEEDILALLQAGALG